MTLGLQIVGVAIVLAILIYAVVSRIHRPYIGYGWMLDWRDGKVIVLSRLLKSPSGRAGVKIGSVLLSYNGKKMNFKTAEDFTSYMDARPEPDFDEVAVFCLQENGRKVTIEMRAETIRSRIPYYPPLPPLTAWGRMSTKEDVGYCRATGQHYIIRRLSGFGYEMMTR